MSLDVSVVVCAYTEDRWDHMSEALASVARQFAPALETILVVDHNDSLLTRARQAFEPAVRVVASDGGPGLSGARNTGIAAARGEVIVFLDDDARADPDWLGHLVAGYTDPTVWGTGGRALPVWPGDGARPGWMPREFDWVVGCSFTGQPDSPAYLRNMLGANMSFRRTAFDLVGGFSESVGRVGTRPVGCEETEFCIRLRQAEPGARLRYEPAAVVHHHVTGTRTTWGYFRSRCYAEGMSKAVVATLVGSQDALESERTYVSSVLPRAVAGSMRDALTRGDRQGWARAGAVVAGLAVTTTGYAVARVRTGLDRRSGAKEQ